MYFFGGTNQKEEAQNSLNILKLDCKPLEWISPSIEGRVPPTRYDHSMSFVESLGFVVIYGGVNEEGYLNDLWLL